ncbi:MAG: DUF72 domain-containing protein [Nitrospira sp. CR1.3]|nr:DUF72 domain-containing protein [Nitrospira sp. CR1.3]
MATGHALVRFGTSSWAYEGWQGLVYHRPYAKSRFTQDSLAEYAAYSSDEIGHPPLFRTVGIDHSFYRPAGAEQLAHYARQVPADFRFCQKVWEEITIPAYANLPRYRAKAGEANPRFLDAGLFRDMVLRPAVEGLGDKLGPFLFEFQRWGIEPTGFLDQLDRFLGQLPPGLAYAVEVRNQVLLNGRYRDILRAHNVAHVYNHWTAMPTLADQHRALEQSFTASFVVFRLLTPLGLAHEKAVERYKPYDRIAQEQPRMRQDTIALVNQALQEGKSSYVLVNNRAEGCSPLTIQALVSAFNSRTSP